MYIGDAHAAWRHPRRRADKTLNRRTSAPPPIPRLQTSESIYEPICAGGRRQLLLSSPRHYEQQRRPGEQTGSSARKGDEGGTGPDANTRINSKPTRSVPALPRNASIAPARITLAALTMQIELSASM